MKKNKLAFFLLALLFITPLNAEIVFANSSLNQNWSGGFYDYNTGNYYDYSAEKEVISIFTTNVTKNDSGKVNNMKIASITIDQKIIEPGQTFSFNDTLGYTSKEKGYQVATIFVNGKEEKAYGGGICQVSTTLYNAALNAGMEIIERHPHSKRVYYVEKGKDAATSYGGKDLKIKNSFDYPITINTYMGDTTFTVELLK